MPVDLNSPPAAPSELERLAVLRQYAILDTPPEQAFDEITALASQLCGCPFALISFVETDRQWNKSVIGWPYVECSVRDSFCAHTVRQRDLLIVENAQLDPLFKCFAPVAGEPQVHFYAGVPLFCNPSSDDSAGAGAGYALGALCVMDILPRRLTPQQEQGLRTLARQVAAHLELRRRLALNDARQQRMETAWKDSEAFYHSLVESLPQNIFRKDLEGRFTFANKRFADTLGLAVSEVIGRTDFDLFPASLAAKYQADDQKVIATLVPYECVEENQSEHQHRRYVQVIKTPLHDSRGRVAGVQGIFWDVTERKRMEGTIAYERDLLQALLDNVPDSIYFKDDQSRFLRINRALSSRLGLFSPETALGRTDFDFFAHEHAQEAFRDEKGILATGRPLIAKVEREPHRGGESRWVLTTKVPFRSVEGAIVGTLGISRDITELKNTQTELIVARDAALESSRLKSEFLANMSHEIRTPMNAIIGMTGLILGTELDPEQADCAQTIRESADALLEIINDILDFSKIEAGKMVIEVVDFDLNEMLESAVDLLAEQAEAKGLELVEWMDETVEKCLRGDPGRIRQILTNLIGNAIKFTESGEVFVSVAAVTETESQVVLRFTVKDTGIGIAPEARERIFQSFTQADGSMTRRYGGTGLGLAISKQLVELMQGTIGVESALGQGSTFWFSLPLEKQSKRSNRLPERVADLAGLRVLVVDDNTTNRQIVHHQVISWKMRNGSVSCGADALSLLRREALAGDPYDLAILDMEMPEMNGLMLARAIAADSLISGVRVILLCPVGRHLQPEVLSSAGVAASLVKPVRQSRLFDCLANVVGEHRASACRPPLPQSFKPAPPIPVKTLRLLLAEDNAVNQKVAIRQLQRLGYAADAVTNGRQALEAVQRRQYDVILMDCQMPELDGCEAARQIRALEGTQPLHQSSRPIYIVAMTANALAGDREECLQAGMNDYISKPVRIEDLESTLQRAVESMEGPAGLPPGPTAEPQPEILQIPAVDPSVIASLRELAAPGEPDPLAELVDLFLQDSPERLQRISGAISKDDHRSLEAAAHSLKGSAGNLGALPLTEICAKLMRLSPDAVRMEAPALAELLAREYERVEIELKHYRDRSDLHDEPMTQAASSRRQ